MCLKIALDGQIDRWIDIILYVDVEMTECKMVSQIDKQIYR